ncbi:MAG: DNA polymerase III subunit gamma/tau [Candidatus Dependentiae bacterium]|jgi:DNA polymerase-3 subunit gamma/tau
MISTTAHLNLARKWRPRTFDQVVGQNMAVSMLRNSLFKNHFFPVYLFAGQKGCGKTSSARIFATAINCEKLAAFQEKPSGQTLPCLECTSCKRMQEGAHADFIEIDAASHTGVDDVRALLESCSFMPLMGSKKIYLIDEAHMLSKAAFNAFLKILEEPPPTVIFMLATTELHKIPETVRSRCFQLQFSALPQNDLVAHLQTVCESEDISFEPAALPLIVEQTDGSARDALNVLEQVRFAGEKVTAAQVRKALGMINVSQLAELVVLMLENKPTELLAALKERHLENLAANRIWSMLLTLCRALLLSHYKTEDPILATLSEELRTRLQKAASRNRLHAILQLLWQQEEVFIATPYKHLFLENIFLQICEQVNIKDLAQLQEALKVGGTAHGTPPPRASTPRAPRAVAAPQPAPTSTPAATQSQPVTLSTASADGWQSFVAAVQELGDPLLASIFMQAKPDAPEDAEETTSLPIKLASMNSFITEKLKDTSAQWKPLVGEHLAPYTSLTLRGGAQKTAPKPTPRPQRTEPFVPPARQAPPQAAQNFGKPYASQRKKPVGPKLVRPRGTLLQISPEEKDKWPLADLLTNHFPGKLETITPPASSSSAESIRDGA